MDIDEEPCHGTNSCRNVGENSRSTNIGERSCFEDGACFESGQGSMGTINIGNEACVGENSCTRLGMESKSMTIEESGCVGNKECQNCMQTKEALHLTIPSGEDCDGKIVE